MIVRIWHGRVPSEKAESYREFTRGRAIPNHQSVEGNLSVYMLERQQGEVTHFITLTFCKDRQSVTGFAGEAVNIAKYHPEDTDYLLEFEPTVVPYEVVDRSCKV